MIKHLPHLQHAFGIAFLFLTINNLNAQSTWHPVLSNNQYLIESSDPVNCNFSGGTVQAEYIFLKVTNLTSQPLEISFRVDEYYVGSGCATCNNSEYAYNFTIPANGFITTDCNFSTTGQYKLAVFKKFINKTNHKEFEKFEITNVHVE